MRNKHQPVDNVKKAPVTKKSASFVVMEEFKGMCRQERETQNEIIVKPVPVKPV